MIAVSGRHPSCGGEGDFGPEVEVLGRRRRLVAVGVPGASAVRSAGVGEPAEPQFQPVGGHTQPQQGFADGVRPRANVRRRSRWCRCTRTPTGRRRGRRCWTASVKSGRSVTSGASRSGPPSPGALPGQRNSVPRPARPRRTRRRHSPRRHSRAASRSRRPCRSRGRRTTGRRPPRPRGLRTGPRTARRGTTRCEHAGRSGGNGRAERDASAIGGSPSVAGTAIRPARPDRPRSLAFGRPRAPLSRRAPTLRVPDFRSPRSP